MKSVPRILPAPLFQVNSENIENFYKRGDYVLNIQEKKLYHKKPSYFFELRAGGYIPKSGICLADYFINNYKKLKIEYALEIGVGELAFLPITLIKNKIVIKIDGVEVDPTALDWSIQNIKSNGLVNEISLYNNIDAVSKHKYDLILSNPPQMPVMKNKSLHDDGGIDGYQVIDQIIRFCNTGLQNNGRLVMLVFDFLNIINKYNSTRPTLTKTLKESGFTVSIKQSIFRSIRPGGRTEQCLNWIKKQYPDYKFDHGDRIGYNLLILEAIKNK